MEDRLTSAIGQAGQEFLGYLDAVHSLTIRRAGLTLNKNRQMVDKNNGRTVDVPSG